MMDEDDRAENGTPDHAKASKRDRLKGALARTKSKFKKQPGQNEESDNILSHDVDEFLSAGRASTSSWTSGHDHDRLVPSTPIPALNPSSMEQSSRPSSSSDTVPRPKQSPRRIPVPRIDVSNSQRWPTAQPIVPQEHHGDGPEFLSPEHQTRSQSASSIRKRKGRGRELSVSFIEAPPVIIGEGGDEALVPPVEISKARARARSFSPMTSRSESQTVQTPDGKGQGVVNNNSNPQPDAAPRPDPPDILRPRGLRRVQTGAASANSASASVSALDKEFEMTLQLGSAVNSPDGPSASPHTQEIIAPKPMRPLRPPPRLTESPEPEVVTTFATDDARKPFREGDILRLHHERDMSDLVDDGSARGAGAGASRRGTSLEDGRPPQRT